MIIQLELTAEDFSYLRQFWKERSQRAEEQIRFTLAEFGTASDQNQTDIRIHEAIDDALTNKATSRRPRKAQGFPNSKADQ